MYDLSMKRRKFNITILILLLIAAHVFAVNKDSLISLYEKSKGERRTEILTSLTSSLAPEQPEKALNFINRYLENSGNINNRHLSDLYKILADIYFEADSLHASLLAYLECIEKEQLSDDIRIDSLGRRYSDAGYVFAELGIFDLALDYHLKALEINRRLNDSLEMAVNYTNIGISYKLTGAYGKAIEAFNHALQIDERTGTENEIAVDYNNIGSVYHAWGRYEDALRFYRKAWEIDFTRGNKNKLAIRLSNIALVYLDMNNIDEAIRNYEIALKIDREQENQVKIPVRLQGLGKAYHVKKSYDKALVYFNEALERFQNLGNDSRIAVLHTYLGELYADWGKTGQAEIHYKKGLQMGEKLGMKPTILDAATGLYNLNKQSGNFREALEYFELFAATNHEIFNENNQRQINEFRIRYETKKTENENILLIKENETRRTTQQFLVAIIFALLTGTISLFYAFRFKSKLLNQNKLLLNKEQELMRLEQARNELERHNLEDKLFAEKQFGRLQKEKFEAEIEYKNRELANSTLALINKNEVLNEIRSKLNTTITGETLADVIRFINLNFDQDHNWNRFKMDFEAIHPGFFNRLKENFPDFSENVIRLCAYLLIGLSSKEIAQLMNVSIDAVNKNRQRLRKRLNLEPEADLTEFLKQL